MIAEFAVVQIQLVAQILVHATSTPQHHVMTTHVNILHARDARIQQRATTMRPLPLKMAHV
jgi:hypothetical protein